MSRLTKITDHVYWMKPGKPDRPSLCAVVGSHHTLLLDAGSSAAHTRSFLEAMTAEGIHPPRYVALTHWHWDHVFGASEIGATLIAQRGTAAELTLMGGYEWTDAALDERAKEGKQTPEGVGHIKEELPAPRTVIIAQPDIVFDERLEIRLGDVTCQIEHVGGDHSPDSSIIYVAEDRLLFLGDCLYDAIYTPMRHYTREKLFPLVDKILQFDAEQFVEGHGDIVMSRAQMEAMIGKMRLVATLVEQLGTDENAVRAAVTAQQTLDEDSEYFIRTLIAGRILAQN